MSMWWPRTKKVRTPLWRCKQAMRAQMRWYGVPFKRCRWDWDACAGPYSPLPRLISLK